jgi:hypothetical protein
MSLLLMYTDVYHMTLTKRTVEASINEGEKITESCILNFYFVIFQVMYEFGTENKCFYCFCLVI